MRVARAVFADACIGLADDFALREILGGEEAGASSDRENKGERKKAFGSYGIEEDTPGWSGKLQETNGLGKPRSG